MDFDKNLDVGLKYSLLISSWALKHDAGDMTIHNTIADDGTHPTDREPSRTVVVRRARVAE